LFIGARKKEGGELLLKSKRLGKAGDQKKRIGGSKLKA